MKIFFITLIFSSFFINAEAQNLACNELENLEYTLGNSLSKTDQKELAHTKEHYCNMKSESVRIGMTLQYSNGQIAVDMLGMEGATWYLPNGEVIDSELIQDLSFERKVAPIEAPFKKHHAKCSGGCSYISWGIWGDEAHKKKASCHNSGGAIDIHALTCGKTKYKTTTAKFQTYLKCMRNHFGVIYGNAAHKNHAHIQLKNCKKIKLK